MALTSPQIEQKLIVNKVSFWLLCSTNLAMDGHQKIKKQSQQEPSEKTIYRHLSLKVDAFLQEIEEQIMQNTNFAVVFKFMPTVRIHFILTKVTFNP